MSTSRRIPLVYHALALAFVASCVWLALRRPGDYIATMQEDRVVEWATVWFFAGAAAIGLTRAVRQRRIFDGLVALFCFVFAGEEMSWGQRLLGLTPPAYFLEHNTQQEMNIHNFGGVFGGPKWPFVAILVGYAVIIPLVALTQRGRRLLDRIGATPLPMLAIPWFVAAICLLVWYPFRFTGEWVELLAGATFFVSMGVTTTPLLGNIAGGIAFALLLSAWSALGSVDPRLIGCATSEVGALVEILRADSSDVLRGALHKRAWTLAEEGYIDHAAITDALDRVRCDSAALGARRRYAVDPWGTAYWVRVRPERDSTILTVYSFGPNRRRDADERARDVGDDILARVTIANRASEP